MARVRVNVSEAQIRRYMLDSPALRAALMAKGEEARRYWQSLPPATPNIPESRLKGKQRTGAYRKSINMTVMRSPTRMKVRVYTKDPKAHWIEYGAKHMPKYAPMAKTRAWLVGQAGFRPLGPDPD